MDTTPPPEQSPVTLEDTIDTLMTSKWARYGAIALAVIVAGVVVYLALVPVDDRPGLESSPEPGRTATIPEIEQARWKIRTFPTGTERHLSKKERRSVRKQGHRLSDWLKETYGALFLDPGSATRTVRRTFTPRAAHAWSGTRSGVPAKAERVRTLIRKADIGIQSGSARRAAVTVFVRARGLVSDKRFAVVHRATLWFERTRRSWMVFAFDVDQEPAR